jgi:uncharacterized DUF497 family protein
VNYEISIDPETNEPHFAKHGVSEQEAIDVLEDPDLVLKGAEDTYSAFGQTRGGRWLRVIYVQRSPETARIITAYTPRPKAVRATRRRIRKKR